MCCFDEKTSDPTKNNMPEESKEQMWGKMMECCCSDMTDEERQKWSKDMHNMMHNIKECSGPMMGAIIGKMHGRAVKGHAPWDMCKDMVSSIRQTHQIATLVTPEVQGLFEDWVEQIKKELQDYLQDKKTVDVKDIASHFKISKDSAYYFLTKLAQKGKIKLSIDKDKS
ncbi:MAG: hypothetical protein JSV17_06340 [Candidatus Aminicenantes bacterium]|nr:MAG: hypothetical protein JSV17_06340 [Candidatus Aminicenantes bacterium]